MAAKKYLVSTVLTVLIVAILYYATIPPINIQSIDFWWFVIEVVIIVGVLFGVPLAHDAGAGFFDDVQRQGLGSYFKEKREAHKQRKDARAAAAEEEAKATTRKEKRAARKKAGKQKKHGFFFYLATVVIVLLACLFIGVAASSPIFNAKAYSNLLATEDGDFATDIEEITMSSVPVVDRSTAVSLGSRTIGEISDLVSQFSIDESDSSYTQISYNDAPYRVAPLVYADIIKWFTNTSDGLPGYVTVNMATQDTELVRLDEGSYMHYSTGEHFNKYLYRHVRFSYPTEILGEAAFELDDDGNPYWIVPTVNLRIGLFGGKDYDGCIIVDACTGEMVKYDLADVPNWVDKVFSADLIYQQLQYYGKYQKGFFNSFIGQSGVLVPTGSAAVSIFGNSADILEYYSTVSTAGAYNYLAINDDVYVYTGMTSANSDESLVGFTLVNLRTKEAKYYSCAGATESSAMDSAEGQVQEKEYTATNPLLLNIADRPTYFLSLKDSAGLVKMYAFIDVQQYQIVGTGSTVSEAQQDYIAALASDEGVDVEAEDLEESDALPTVDGVIEAIQAVVVDGDTIYYLKLAGDASIYTAEISISEQLPFLASGDAVTVTYSAGDDVNEISAITTAADAAAAEEEASEEDAAAEDEEAEEDAADEEVATDEAAAEEDVEA